MIDWYLLLTPLFLIPITLLLVFVGCGLPDQGTLTLTCTVTDLSSTPQQSASVGTVGPPGTSEFPNPINAQSTDTIEVNVTTSSSSLQGVAINTSMSPSGPWPQFRNIPLSNRTGKTTFTVSEIATSGSFFLQLQAVYGGSGSTFGTPGQTYGPIPVNVQ